MKSIRWTLLAFLLPTLALWMAGELWLSWRELRSAANAAYEAYQKSQAAPAPQAAAFTIGVGTRQ